MPRFLFAHYARLLPEQWQRDRFARVAFRNGSHDPAQLFARIANYDRAVTPSHV
jgi:hypothetical protein